MPTHPNLNKVLIIGAGPIRIGHTGAFDTAAVRACDVIRAAGAEPVVVHCDPSAQAADLQSAARTYLVPLTPQALAEVILHEKPDALLPTVGGPVALRLAQACLQSDLLDRNGVQLLGISPSALALIDDPAAWTAAVEAAGLVTPAGQSATTVADAAAIAEEIGYPVFVRAVVDGASARYGIAFNIEELRGLTTGGRLPADATGRFRIETALSGYREVEVELLRDAGNRTRIVAIAENMDPVGVHSGDSTVAIPPLGVSAAVMRRIETAASTLADHLHGVGALHLKFAVAPDTDQILVLALDPRFSRMTAFCAKAFDIDLAAVHTRLALGLTLTDAIGDEQAGIDAAGKGATVAVRLPRWEFERFPGEARRLSARMRSTGETMGLGRNLLQALQAAVRSRTPAAPLLGLKSAWTPLSIDDLMRELVTPSPDRLYVIHEALKKGAAPKALADLTGIGVEWLEQLARLADLEVRLSEAPGMAPTPALLEEALGAGYEETGLSLLTDLPASAVREGLRGSGVKRRPCAAGENPRSRTWFHAPDNGVSLHTPLGKSVVVVGTGCGRIGQNIELDHCCGNAAAALRAAGRQVLLVSANPASACGSKEIQRTYIAPVTAADLIAICRSESPDGVILQFGGHGAVDLAADLSEAGVPVLGTPHASMVLSQDRLRFSELLTDLGIPHPPIGVARSPEEAMDLAEQIGYPLAASPLGDRQGGRRIIIMDVRALEQAVMRASVSPAAPLLVEQFLEYAIEVEADALADGRNVYVPAVMEHIELAGVHSGDAAMVVPPYSTPPRHIETIEAYVRKIALELGVVGLLNTRFAVYNDTVYLLEARPWACRTLPLVSKICNVPMARRAVQIMLGMALDEMDLPRRLLPHYGIRASVFPFDTFTETDPLLGPLMRATGQVMAMADVFGMAYFSSQEAAGVPLPLGGNVLITVTDADKPSILEPARLFKEMGFGIQATRGTHAFLKRNGIEAQLVKKLGFGRPDLVDGMKTGDVALVVNTPSGRQSQQDDAYIRKTAIRYRIPNITTPAGALAAAKGIAARKRGQDALSTLQSYVRAIK